MGACRATTRKECLGCGMCVFKVKYNSDGSINQHKVMLVVKGYEKYSIQISNQLFLNGDLEEEIYVTNLKFLWFKVKKPKCIF